MRSSLIALAAIACASVASAQERTPLPFAPPVPSTFTVEEVRALTAPQSDGVRTTTSTTRYRLEFRAHRQTYDVIWTLLSVENAGDAEMISGLPFWPLSDRLVGLPVAMTLNDSGGIDGISNLDTVNRVAFAGADPPSWTGDARRVASLVAAALASVSPCQGTDLQVGRIERDQRDDPRNDNVIFGTIVVTHELQSLQPSSAHVAFTRTESMHRRGDAPNAPLFFGLDLRSDCIVDTRTGMTLSATTDMRATNDVGPGIAIHSTITVAPQ